MSKKPVVPVASRETDGTFEVTVHRYNVYTIQLQVSAASHKDAVRLAEATAADHQKLFDKTEAHSCRFQALGSRQLSDLAVSNNGAAGV